jgi:hypothetical protein
LLFRWAIAKEAAMCTKWTRTSLLIAMLAAAPVAWAGGSQTASQKGGADPATKTLPASASDTAKASSFGQSSATHSQSGGQNQGGGADPATKTLPATASDTAKANAFGVQGAKSKAAHQAAQAAASQAAHAAVTGAQGQPPAAGTSRPAAAATANASTTGVTNGFDRAAAGSTNGQGSTHRH